MNKKIKNWNGLNVWLIGASDGIGAALARNLLKKGVELTVSSRNKDKLDDVVTGYPNAKIKVLDVLDLQSLQKTMDEMEKCDLVIYMAADYYPMTSDKIDPVKAARIIDVNFKGAVNVSSTAISFFVKKGYGHLSLVASIAGLIGLPQSSVYGATKAALINFGESLFHDLKPLGLDVSIVNPGFVKTRLTEKNNFEMPFIMSPAEAAENIVKGYESGKFSITFPFIFSLFFRTIRVLPYSLHFKLLKAFVKT